MRYNYSEEFQGLTNGEINRKFIDPSQNKLLQQWMGRGVRGALDAHGGFAPIELEEKTLRAYHEIARRMIAADNDSRGTQAARIDLIEQALDHLQQNRNNE